MTEIRYVGANDVEENYQVVKTGDVIDHPDAARVRALVGAGLWELAKENARLPRVPKAAPEPGEVEPVEGDESAEAEEAEKPPKRGG